MPPKEQKPVEVGRLVGYTVVNSYDMKNGIVELLCICGKKYKKHRAYIYGKKQNCGCIGKESRRGIVKGKVTCVNCHHDTTEIEKRQGLFCRCETAGYNKKGECDSWELTKLKGVLACPYEDGLVSDNATGKVKARR